MKKISECNYNYREPFVDPAPKFTEEDYKVVNELFAVFRSIFPAFRQAWPTDEDFERSKREWIKAFKLSNLNSLETIKLGVDKYRLLENPFVPSPGQFIAMCKEEKSEVPAFYIPLPKPEVSVEKQKAEMQKIMESLGKKK